MAVTVTTLSSTVGTCSIPLGFLSVGERACVCEVCGDPGQVHRLAELGFRPGAEVQMVQAGSPCIVRVCGAKLCFRDTDALQVLVVPEKAA